MKGKRKSVLCLTALLAALLAGSISRNREVAAFAQDELLGAMPACSVYAGAQVTGEAVWYTRETLLKGLLLCVGEQSPLPKDMPAQQARNVRKMIGLYVPVAPDVSLAEETIYALCSLCDENPLLHTWIVSGMRSPAEQAALQNETFEQLRGRYTVAEALYYAQRDVPTGGKSEHQLNSAFDVWFQGSLDWAYEDALDRSSDGRWLRENAWRFGFIRRYPPEKAHVTGVLTEELHFRYVGKTHAMVMQATGWCLEEYLAALKTYGGVTVITTDGEVSYVLYDAMSESGAAFPCPTGYSAAPSADNQGGAVCVLTPDQSSSG